METAEDCTQRASSSKLSKAVLKGYEAEHTYTEATSPLRRSGRTGGSSGVEGNASSGRRGLMNRLCSQIHSAGVLDAEEAKKRETGGGVLQRQWMSVEAREKEIAVGRKEDGRLQQQIAIVEAALTGVGGGGGGRVMDGVPRPSILLWFSLCLPSFLPRSLALALTLSVHTYIHTYIPTYIHTYAIHHTRTYEYCPTYMNTLARMHTATEACQPNCSGLYKQHSIHGNTSIIPALSRPQSLQTS